MKHTIDSLMALADAYAEISAGSTTAHAVEMQEALRAALAEALKERDALKLDAERLDWLDTQCSEGNGRHLACLPGGLRQAIDAAMKGAA